MSIANIKSTAIWEHNDQPTSHARAATKNDKKTRKTGQSKTQQQQQKQGPATPAQNASASSSTITPANADQAAAGMAPNEPTTGSKAAGALATTTSTLSTAVLATQLTYLPQTSLLKIEPFVPSLNARRLQRRPIGRSLSTLSTLTTNNNNNNNNTNSTTTSNATHIIASYAKRPSALNLLKPTHGDAQQPGELLVGNAVEQQRHTRATISLRRLPVRGTMARQRSKSTSSSAASAKRPATATPTATSANVTQPAATAATGTLINGAIVTPQPNGICRIARLPAEQQQLPDRINYDRRGLTAIPIFEHEPNLRLLSLQHNLINIFHIPKAPPPTPPPPAPPPLPPPLAADDKASQCSDTPQPGRCKQLPAARRMPQSPKPKLQRQNGCCTPPLPAPLTTQPMPLQGQLAKRNSLQQRHFNFNAPHLPHKQQRPTHARLGIERSKSFISQPRHLHQLRRQLHKMHAKAEPPHVPANLKSFDCAASYLTTDSTLTTLVASELEEDEHLQQLQIKNAQLRASYGTIFQHLVFLDLYDNQIERIANLDGLSALSVLLLGKNRITDISGLSSLQHTLRVLDLHGNKLSSISNKINCLRQLKSLNLAGNLIRQINHNDFNGLVHLKELNLKRNKIKRINGFQHLCALERLWLCHNELHKVDDMASIAQATSLLELTIENNPVSLAGDCVSFLVSYLPQLQSLSQMPITEQVRQAAMAWRKHKELSATAHAQAHTTPDAFNSIRREEVISNARTNWELLRSQQSVQTALRKQRDGIKPSELAKINESVEAGVGYEELQEMIKLPPIATQTTSTTPKADMADAVVGKDDDVQSDTHSRSTASSLGPNIDSSSSCFSSDNEESNKLDAAQDIEKPNTDDPKTSNAQSSPKAANSSLSSPSSGHDTDTTSQRPSHTNNTNTTITNVTTNKPTTANGECKPTAATPTASNATRLPTAIVGQLPATHNTPSTSCRRYMQGSLMRSHTIANSHHAPARHNAARRHNSPSQPRPTPNAPQKLAQAAPNAPPNSKAATSPGHAATTTTTTTTSSSSNAPLPAASSKPAPTEREREQGGDYLIEICGRYLNIYGQGALRFIDKQWNAAKANDVHTLNFSYINYNNITATLARIKVRFPHAEHFVFRETNICALGQLHALAELQGITTLAIDPEGNPITAKPLWRQYAIYRLSHWGLKQLNGAAVSDAEVDQSNAAYAGLSDLVLWSMPEVMLQPLLTRLRLDETCTASKMSPKQWLMKPDNHALRLVVGKEALQWKKATATNAPTSNTSQQQPSNAQVTTPLGNRAMFVSTAGGASGPTAQPAGALSTRERGKMHFALMLENTCNAIEKLHQLETLWPSLLLDMVRNTLVDYQHLDNYIRHVLDELLDQH